MMRTGVVLLLVLTACANEVHVPMECLKRCAPAAVIAWVPNTQYGQGGNLAEGWHRLYCECADGGMGGAIEPPSSR